LAEGTATTAKEDPAASVAEGTATSVFVWSTTTCDGLARFIAAFGIKCDAIALAALLPFSTTPAVRHSQT
jgi:hypothetical protein